MNNAIGTVPINSARDNRPLPTTNSSPQSKHEAKQQLSQAIIGAHEILTTATTIFPFTLFPDTVTVDREKVTINHRMFWMVAEVISIRVEDILNVKADFGPFFGSLKITSRFFDQKKPYVINYLWRSDALRINRVLQGYVSAIQKGIDCSVLSPQELTKLLDELGQTPSGNT